MDIMGDIDRDENSAVTAFISENNNVIHYEAYQTDEAVVDFNGNTEAFHADIGHLDYGVYMVRIEYKTTYDTSQNLNSPICTFTLSGKNNDHFMYDVIKLYEYRDWIESPVWVTSISGVDDFHININFIGYGYCDISHIKIYEYTPWKIGFLMLIFLVFTISFLALYKFYYADLKTRLSWFLLGLLVFFSSYLCAIGNNRTVAGDDFSFHISRIASMANEIRYHHIPVLYQSDAIGGYGYIAPVMYGNIFLYIPAFMHLLGMPLSISYNMYIVLVNCVTCFICQYSFKRLFKKNRYAILGTALYLLSAYRIINIYIRTAVGEYTAMAFLPLVLYGFYRIYFEKENVNFDDTLPLIIGISGIVESHILTIEMSILFIVLFVFLHFKRTIKNLISLLQALFMVIVVNLFFIVPFIDAYRQELNINSRKLSSNIVNSEFGLSQIFGIWISKEGRIIGFSLVIGIIIFLIACICKKGFHFNKKEMLTHRLAVECFLYGLLSIWISSCYFPGKELEGKSNVILKIFTSIQFSSRYLLFATLFLVVSTVYAVKKISENGIEPEGKHNFFIVMAAGLIGICIFVNGNCYSELMESEDLRRTLSKAYISADGLYLPKGMNYNLMPDTTIISEPRNVCLVEKRGTTNSNDKIFYVYETRDNCKISLPIVYYDYIKVYDFATEESFNTEKGTDGRLTIKLQKGYCGELIVSYEVKNLWKASYIISLLFCIGILIVYCKKDKVRNSRRIRKVVLLKQSRRYRQKSP